MTSPLARIVVALLLVAAGAALGAASTPPVVVPVRNTLSAQQAATLARAWRIEREGLRARLEGVAALPPDTVYHVDTLPAPPPEVVYEFVSIRQGVVTSGALVFDSTGLVLPQVHRTRFTNCDDGLEVSEAGVICDPARLGHLYLGASVTNLDARLGAWWTPSYASPWEFGGGLVQPFGGSVGWYVGVRRGWRVF